MVVIPAEAEIQETQSRLGGGDGFEDFLPIHHYYTLNKFKGTR
jgi:hypothetical protein